MDINEFISVDVDVEKLLKHLHRAQKGKRKNGEPYAYISLRIVPRKTKDFTGNSVSVTLGKTREELNNKVPTIYVGQGDAFKKEPQGYVKSYEAQESTTAVSSHPIDDNDDLPF